MNEEIDAEKVSLWNRTAGSGRPLRALWLTNATGLTLDGGSMTLIDGDAFAGEGLIEPLKPGEKRLMSYAADLGVLVDARMAGGRRRILRVRAREGIMTQETEERVTCDVQSAQRGRHADDARDRARSGRDGSSPRASRRWSTADAQRFRVVCRCEERDRARRARDPQGESRVTLGDHHEALIAQLAKSGMPAAALQQALKPLIDKKSEVAATRSTAAGSAEPARHDWPDQQRLRENMKALRGSAEEKQLLQRYTRQLDEQETRLETLQTEMAAQPQTWKKCVGNWLRSSAPSRSI